MNSHRYLSPDLLSAWTFRFYPNGRVYGRLEGRDDYGREEWGLARKQTFSTVAALRKIKALEDWGWKLG